MDEKIPYLAPAQSFLDQLQQLQVDQFKLKDMMRQQMIDALASGMSVRLVHHDGTSQLIEPKLYRSDHVIVSGKSRAVVDVLIERERQQRDEGWTPDHDDQHTAGEMAWAAACYALIGLQHHPAAAVRTGDQIAHETWPWALQWFKPTERRRDLVKAAALLLAEIERLDRAAGG